MNKLINILQCEKRKKSLIKRFWSKVNIKSDLECWEWIAKSKTEKGYGVINAGRNNGTFKAHRVSYCISKGLIPDGSLVLHSCDNPGCCNPNHLRIGTAKENTSDAIERKRIKNPPVKLGEDHHNTKFTSKELKEIIDDKRTYKEISNHFGVSIQTIYRVKNRKTWKNEG